MDNRNGRCANCGKGGATGNPCATQLCREQGYHPIPLQHWQTFSETPQLQRDPLIGVTVEDYLVVGQLGRGTYGKVYMSLLLPLLMPAALKVLIYKADNPKAQSSVLKKFEQEALSLAHLSHPNLVRLLKYGTFHEMPFIVMEYVNGGKDLYQEMKRRFKERQPFEPFLIRHIMGQTLNALECAHQRSIIHRDIKPSNIMLQPVAGDNFFVRVLDFGLAKFIESRRDTSYIVGTPYYMAPEQVLRKDIGPWSDLYALGMIIMEMVSGKRFHLAENTEALLTRKREPNFDPLTFLSPEVVHPELQAFFGKALAWDHRERFRDVSAFRQAMLSTFSALIRDQNPGDSFESDSEMLRLQNERAQLQADIERFKAEREALQSERAALVAHSAGTGPPKPVEPAGSRSSLMRQLQNRRTMFLMSAVLGAVVAIILVLFLVR